jgi:hypothetical protein
MHNYRQRRRSALLVLALIVTTLPRRLYSVVLLGREDRDAARYVAPLR